jgi:hypothetical protein
MFYQGSTLIDLLLENPATILIYSVFFLILAILLSFMGHLGKIFPKTSEKQNFVLARIYTILAIFGISFTVFIAYAFIWLRWRDLINFEFFAIVEFILPLILGPLIFAPFYLTQRSDRNDNKLNGREVDNRNSFELMVVYAAFGIIASNFHDILWCGTKTNWFVETQHNGYELEIWVKLVGANTYSYVFFVFYMTMHVLFCIIIATIFLQRYARRYNTSLLKDRNLQKAYGIAWLGALLWGYGIFIMDSKYWHPEISWLIGTFLWIPLGYFILGFSAKYLVKFELSML